MVQRRGGVGVLEQDKLQRRVGDGEVRVAGTFLAGLGPEHVAVHADGRGQVGDVEGELNVAGGGHLQLP